MAVLRATIMGVHYSQAIYNVVHFHKDAYVTADLSNLANDIYTNWLTYCIGRMTSEFTYTNINVRRIDGGTDPPFDKAVLVAGIAGSDHEMIPTNCWVMKLHTAVIGRHGRGRIYMPCMGHLCIQEGLIKPTCLTDFNSTASSIMTRYGPGGASSFALVISNRSDPSSFNPVTSISIRPTPGTQRRRGIGVGI